MSLKNMKVGSRLLLGFAIPLVLFVAFGIWLLLAMTNISGHMRIVKTESVPFALAAKSMEKEVVQVQQWLTDISATRGLDNLNDGFVKAEESRAAFLRDLDKFRNMYATENDQAGIKEIERIRADFEMYYESGVKMANAYVNGGPAEGNKLMGQFDKASQALQDALAPFIKAQMDEMIASIDESDEETDHASQTALFTLVTIIVVTLVASRTIARSIVRPLT